MEENHLLATMENPGQLFLPGPLDYIRFMNLVFNCSFVITDSGGIQEETSYLGIPCLTLRKNTERPVTITHGTNQLCELDQLRRKTGEVLEEQRADAGGYRTMGWEYGRKNRGDPAGNRRGWVKWLLKIR